jgi:hypothetical protein
MKNVQSPSYDLILSICHAEPFGEPLANPTVRSKEILYQMLFQVTLHFPDLMWEDKVAVLDALGRISQRATDFEKIASISAL